MKKLLMLAVAVSGLGLAGCVAVPIAPRAYGPPPAVYVSPPAVVVRPYAYGRYGYYGNPYRGYY